MTLEKGLESSLKGLWEGSGLLRWIRLVDPSDSSTSLLNDIVLSVHDGRY